MDFLVLSEWTFSVGRPSGLLSRQGSDISSEDVSLQLLLSFISPTSAEAETSSEPAPHHAGWGWPSAGCPEAVSLQACVPARGEGEPRGPRSPLISPQALLQQRNRKFWAQERDLAIQASEDGKNSRVFSEGSAHICGWYVCFKVQLDGFQHQKTISVSILRQSSTVKAECHSLSMLFHHPANPSFTPLTVHT